MNIGIRDNFIHHWKKYFNNADLPITFYYTDNPENATIVPPSSKWSCLICELQKVRSGQSLAFTSDSLKSYMDESFLITDSWKKVQKRIM